MAQIFRIGLVSDQQIGHWTFPVEQARQNWYGEGMLSAYILKCPWEKTPGHAELTVKVTFHDELTGREFTEQRVVRVKLKSQI